MNGNTLSFPRCPGWSGPDIPEVLLIWFWFPGSSGNRRKIITEQQIKTFIFHLAIFSVNINRGNQINSQKDHGQLIQLPNFAARNLRLRKRTFIECVFTMW